MLNDCLYNPQNILHTTVGYSIFQLILFFISIGTFTLSITNLITSLGIYHLSIGYKHLSIDEKYRIISNLKAITLLFHKNCLTLFFGRQIIQIFKHLLLVIASDGQLLTVYVNRGRGKSGNMIGRY